MLVTTFNIAERTTGVCRYAGLGINHQQLLFYQLAVQVNGIQLSIVLNFIISNSIGLQNQAGRTMNASTAASPKRWPLYFKSMKFQVFLLSLFFSFISFSQDHSPSLETSKFRIELISYNHAGTVMDGNSVYIVSDSFVLVRKTFFGAKQSDTLFFKRFLRSRDFIQKIKELKIDTLVGFYFNRCITPMSGDDYHLYVVYPSVEKTIHLHHYYLKQVEDIIDLMNSQIPKRYRVKYLQKDQQQDCSLF